MCSASESGSSCPKYTQKGRVMHSTKWKPSPAALPLLHSSVLLDDCKRRERTSCSLHFSLLHFSKASERGGCFCAMAVAQQKQDRGQLHPNPPPRALGLSQDDHHFAGPGEETEITCAEDVSCLA